MELSEAASKELQQRVGVTEEMTDEVFSTVRAHSPSLELLPVLNLLLLERYEATVPLVRAVIDKSYDLEYITSLQKSRFFMQRMSVPQLSSGIPPCDRRNVLHTSLRDGAIPVVREAVRSIIEDSPFSDSDLYEIAEYLSSSKYAAVRTLSADILALRSQTAMPLLESLLQASAWRLRLRFAVLFSRFGPEDQAIIAERLISDGVDEARVHLAKHLRSLDYIHLLKDPSEYVRSTYLANIVDKIEDEHILIELANDSCWDVRKQVLKLGPAMFGKLATPLIEAISERASWRTSHEILSILDDRCGEEQVIKQVMEYLFSKLRDRVSVVRFKASMLLSKVVLIYPWTAQYREHVERAAASPNYLYRIVAIPLAIAYDQAHNTAIAEVFRDDAVPNVRQCYADYCLRGKADVCLDMSEHANL